MKNLRRRPLTFRSPISKEEIALGIAQGRALIELRDCPRLLHRNIEELIEEGKAFAGEWTKHPRTGETYRTIYKRPLKPDEKVKKDVAN